MVELVDTLDLGSSAERCVGSTPSIRTKLTLHGKLFYFKSNASFHKENRSQSHINYDILSFISINLHLFKIVLNNEGV